MTTAPTSHQAISASFGQASAHYDANAHIQAYAAATLAGLIQRYFPSPATLLDAGAGTGLVARMLSYEGASHQIIALDQAYAMCETLHTHMQCPALCADVIALPLRTASLDGYASSLCWQWVEDIDAAITEMHRCIKEGGYGIIGLLTDETFPELHISMERIGLDARPPAMPSALSISDAFTAHGLQIVSHLCESYISYHTDALHFLRSLKQIGAAPSMTQPLHYRQMQQLFRFYDQHYAEQGGVRATYALAYWVVQKREASASP